jgi:quercetin dioxygenase-like cupin family protein
MENIHPIVTLHRFNGMLVTVFNFNEGDKVPKHKHANVHTTAVSKGKSRVEIWSDDESSSTSFEMIPGTEDYVLPPDRFHEVTALENGTVIVHIIEDPNPTGYQQG